jgi:hypothetical protein
MLDIGSSIKYIVFSTLSFLYIKAVQNWLRNNVNYYTEMVHKTDFLLQ